MRCGMAEESVKVTLRLNPKTIAKLRQLAKDYGLVTTAGRMAGQGSISRLLDGVGSGEYVIDPLITVTPEQMRAGIAEEYGARVAELWDMVRAEIRNSVARGGKQLALPLTDDDDAIPVHIRAENAEG